MWKNVLSHRRRYETAGGAYLGLFVSDLVSV